MSETQNVETNSSRDIKSVNSVAEPIAEKIEVPESAPVEVEKAAPVVEVSQEAAQPSEKAEGEGELPDHFKRRLGKEQKKHERELARVRAELEEIKARSVPQQPQYGAQSPSGYPDPITGRFIDTSTPEGQVIYQYQQQMSQHLNAQEKAQQEQQQKEVQSKLFAHFQDSFEDAKEKHQDFDNVVTSSGMTGYIAQELAYFPDPGELGYYLASNPREVQRLQNLPVHEMRRELARHMAEMVTKNNVTRAPAPVKPIPAGGANPVKHFAHKTIAELKAERRAQLSGQSRRR
jgi:hypothetical protein